MKAPTAAPGATPPDAGQAPSELLPLLWAARSVAVIGASSKPGSLGRLPVEYLLRYGYSGQILPINPKAGEVCGLPAYPELPHRVDLALIMVGAEHAPAAVEQCARHQVPVAIVGASGFAEAGQPELQAELLARAGTKTRLLGPNCIGAANLHTGLVASFSPWFGGAQTTLGKPGGLALVSQSGALGFGAASLAVERGLPLGWVVTTGNEADVTALEVLAGLAAEPECTALLGYVESLSDGPALRKLASYGKPVTLLVAGRSVAGRKAAASHTGALATDDRVATAVLRQLGIKRVSDVDALLDAGEIVRTGRRIAVVTTSGGSGILAADAIEEHGLELAAFTPETQATLDAIVPAFGSAANPVDVTATVMRDQTLVSRCLQAIDADPGVDAILLCFCVLTGEDVDGIVESVSTLTKPVVVARTGAEHLAPEAARVLKDQGVPCFATPARAIAAMARPVPDAAGAETKAAEGDVPAEPPSEQELKRILGLPVPYGRFLEGPEDFPFEGKAVYKAVAPGLVHKTEAGGVLLGVTRPGAGTAYKKIKAIGQVWAEEQVEGGVEMLVGITPSPLGRLLTIGAGGTLAELLGDVAVRLLPVADVEAMLGELKIEKLLKGWRGAPACDIPAFVSVVRQLVERTANWPADWAIELNPVLVRPSGAVVLDAACVREEV
ncbi:acetate--CoA ligase family protein [Longispora albida]|uniref:acetate--CoA ligase family protein n=1 Tax=Longispora albida TaxID=203523 RepID=UPI001B7FA8C8|nr:acetate--CoA ligase family protein [Longispora albida]